MIIQRILNNNVVIIHDQDGEEQVVCGKGLAYKKKVGEEIDDALVNKVFILKDKEMNEKFRQLLSDIPIEHIQLASEIVETAQARLGKRLNDSLIISLSDHIYTSINRFQEGIKMKNALLWDIKRFYEDEFEIGMISLDMIEKNTSIRLPEDEAGFIAVHIVNAEMGENLHNIYEITTIMQEILNIVKFYFHIDFDAKSVYYYRFVTHLKFFALRLIKGNVYEDNPDDELFHVVKNRYRTSYHCVLKIDEFLQKKYKYILTSEEILYLTIHIERIIYKTKDES